jgi:hypothetical protein
VSDFPLPTNVPILLLALVVDQTLIWSLVEGTFTLAKSASVVPKLVL